MRSVEPSAGGHPAHYVDPVLVDLYDVEASSFDYHAEFRTLAGTSPLRIVDVGCGTGLLALALAAGGHAVTGIDPAPGMIAAARAKPNPRGARFIEVDGRNFAVDERFDLALMTGNAFQALAGVGDQQAVIRRVAAHLVAGGRFIFDTRNPAAREWLCWTEAKSRITLTHPSLGNVDVWWEAELGGDGVTVSLVTHYRFADGSRKRSDSLLRFTTPDAIAAMLAAAALPVETIHAGAIGRPFTGSEPDLIVVARKS